MKTYTIERANGDKRTANSMSDAKAKARLMLGVSRVFKGAEYQTDRFGQNGDREYCTGLDIWTSLSDANREMCSPAPVVISWKMKNMTEENAVDAQGIIDSAVETWYERTGCEIAKGDEADEAINAKLDVRGLRVMRGGEYELEGTAEEFAGAVSDGMDEWLAGHQA